MTETANLGMPFIEGSQAQKHITHNEALRILDDVIQIGVLDTALTEPPSSPAEGARYIVAADATGDWADRDGAVGTFGDGAWRFLTPKPGWCAWSVADEAIFVFDGAIWRDLRDVPVTLAGMSNVGVNATASSPNLLTVHSNAALFYAIASADGGSGDSRLQISKEGTSNIASVVFSEDFSGRAEFGLVESNAFKLKVSDDGTTFVEALAIDQTTGNATLPRGVVLAGVIAPPQLTADENDYAPTGFESASVVRISADAVHGISGLAEGSEGRVLCLINTGAFAVILRNEDAGSTAANRFGFGSDVTLAAKQGALLIYDGDAARWRRIGDPAVSGSSGGAGATDPERQNALLTLVYQSRLFAEYRRAVNVFATGFKGANDAVNGIDGGASSNYMVDSSIGKASPSLTSGAEISRTDGTTIGNMTERGGIAAVFDGTMSQMAASSAGKTAASGFIGKDYGSGVTHQIGRFLVYAPSNSTYTANGGGTVTIELRGDNSAPSTGAEGTLLHSASGTQVSADVHDVSSGIVSAAFRYVWVRLVQSGAAEIVVAEVRFFESGATSNMTLVTAAQNADSAVSNGRVLLEFDNTASPVPGTDLTVEVSCDGGTNWTAASLSAVTSWSQGGRGVVESADTACTACTSFAARVKTLNNKLIPIYGLSLSVH